MHTKTRVERHGHQPGRGKHEDLVDTERIGDHGRDRQKSELRRLDGAPRESPEGLHDDGDDDRLDAVEHAGRDRE